MPWPVPSLPPRQAFGTATNSSQPPGEGNDGGEPVTATRPSEQAIRSSARLGGPGNSGRPLAAAVPSVAAGVSSRRPSGA